MDLRLRLLRGLDRALAAALVGLLLAPTLAFGGLVWWARPALAALAACWALGLCLRGLVAGQFAILKSPLTLLGALALGLGLAQLLPLPAALARRVSAGSQVAYATGVLPGPARADDPELGPEQGSEARSPISLDRAATLRSLAWGLACLAAFWGSGQFVDRLGRLYLVWGAIVAAFGINTAIALVQVASDAPGLYGAIHPGQAPSWAPSTADLLTGPTATTLRVVAETRPTHPAWALARPDRMHLLGTMLGGPGAYLALAALGLPLALALTLQVIAPRGGREGLWTRLGQSGQGSLVALLVGLIVVGGALTGAIAGPWASLPFALAYLVVGLPSAWPTGLRWAGVGLTGLALGALGLGLGLGGMGLLDPAWRPLAGVEGWTATKAGWAAAWRVVAEFPVLGSGLGSFAAVEPYYKRLDVGHSTASSSLLQWWAEAGTSGMGLLGLAAVWALVKLPGALRRVGTADRALACGLVGAGVAFAVFSAVHWTVQLAAVALAASALAGLGNRWLAGGTDLFVERG